MTTRSMEAPFGWLMRMGMGLLSFFAQFGETASGESPAGGGGQAQGSAGEDEGIFRKKKKDQTTGKKPPFPQPACCGVALPNGPYCDYSGSDPSTFTCPPGYNRQWWFCPTQPPPYGACAECTPATTCWQGPFNCSTWWYV
jgi:hypothetical protein